MVESVNEDDVASEEKDGAKEQIVDLFVNYCYNNHKTILKEKLREKKMIP